MRFTRHCSALLLALPMAGLSAQRPPRPPRQPQPATPPIPAMEPALPSLPITPAPRPPARPMRFDFTIPEIDPIDLDEIRASASQALAIAQSGMAEAGMATAAIAAARAGMNLDLSRSMELLSSRAGGRGEMPPRAWAAQDPADSLWRTAREAFSRGDYRRAAALFKSIPQRQAASAYAADALYYEAFSLYRIGGTAELQEALAVLDARKAKYPAGRSRSDPDPALPLRIAGVLASRGLGDRELVRRALSEGSNACDAEEQSVRGEALRALRQTDPDAALQLARKILGRKDECSVPLRRSALWLVASKPDAAAVSTLASVARSDASTELRAEATSFLGRMPGDDALATLEELARSDDARVQHTAVRALTRHPSPRARQAMRALVEKNGSPEELRLAALSAFEGEHANTEDASWLRTLYGTADNARVKAAIVSAVGRIGGEANDQWLLGLSKNEDESIDVRLRALRRVARGVEIAALTRFYDGVAARPLREEIIGALGSRTEPEAAGKLVDIARSSTDPQLRRAAINQLSRKKDPRTTQLLLEIIDGKKP